MFGLFKKKDKLKKEITFDYSTLQVDMHSHILPGIDDGAKTPEESIVLIKSMMELGIKKFIATPHVMIDYYRNTPESINGALAILKDALKVEGIDVVVEAAAEHYFDETFEQRVDEDRLITMTDNHALFEFSFINQPPNAIQVIQKMTKKGIKPILAHPERYPYLSIDELRMIRSWGCRLQLNTISLTGYYGEETKKKAEALVDNELIDFISSDMHHPRHAAAFKDALRTPHLEKLLFETPLKNTMLL